MFSVPAFAMPQQVIDEVLADGGNDRDSKFLITARMKKDFPIEENAAYLRRNYRTGGKGFMLDGKRVSAWWDADGIRIDYGNTAQAGSATALSWEQAARRVRELLDMGRYMSQDELDVVDHMERRDLAERLLYVYGDDFHKQPPEWNTHKGFPDDAAHVAELLAQPETRDQIIENLRADASAQETEHSGQRRWHNAHRLLDDVSALQRDPLTFASGNRQSFPDDRRFITQDEIDAALCGGSMVQGGKGRIYRYYQATHTDKERADFLI